MDNLTWSCDICGARKSDEKIGVLSYPLKGIPAASVNLKYCKDTKNCYKKAKKWSLTGKFPYERKNKSKVKKDISTLKRIFSIFFILVLVAILVNLYLPDNGFFLAIKFVFYVVLLLSLISLVSTATK